MPAKSARQYNLMAMAAHDPQKAEKVGVPVSVAKEFVAKTPAKKRKSFAKRRGNR